MSTIHHSYRQRQRAKQQRTNLYLIIGVGLVLFVAGSLMWLAMSQPAAGRNPNQGPAVQGLAAPDFELKTLAGQTAGLDDYAGQVVIVNLWATWCPPCRLEMPALNDFYESQKEQGLVVLAVNAQEEMATVRGFIEEMGFTFPVLLDSQGLVINRYDVRSFPTTFIIDRQGIIRYIHTGAITTEQLQAVVGPLL